MPAKASEKLRPMLDQIRETIFNVLGKKTDGSVVLDAFAGTGVLGLECLSREARYAVFVEVHRPTAQRLHDVLRDWQLAEQSKVVVGDFLRRGKAVLAHGPFDLIFIDPPYNHGLVNPALAAVKRFGLLADEGVAIARYVKSEQVVVPEGMTQIDERKFGDAKVILITEDNDERVNHE